jgi:uncharacterized membrane protein YjjP (DUF1212 family)
LLTAFGVIAATTMVVSYALEDRHRYWIAVFAVGCAATAFYGLLTGAWIFAVLETLWAAVATHKYLHKPETT